jgi:hypothetical protein
LHRIRMIKKDMIEFFGMNRVTLNNWENQKQGEKREFLYFFLENIPKEYVQKLKESFDIKKNSNQDLERVLNS